MDETIKTTADECMSGCSEETLQNDEKNLETNLEEVLRFMYSQPLNREIYYRILEFCKERRMLNEVEEYIQTLPEFPSAVQSPFFIMEDLRIKGALICLELDENHVVITDEDLEGLDEDEIDDLIVDFAYENSELGNAAALECSPQARFAKLTGGVVEDSEAYFYVMEYLQEKRGASSIDSALCQWQATSQTKSKIKCSTVIDKLEKAGIIVWQQGWLITKEGKELLTEFTK